MASWLVRTTPDRPVWVRDLTGDIVLCSWARHFTLTMPLSMKEYKIMVTGKFNVGGKPVMD